MTAVEATSAPTSAVSPSGFGGRAAHDDTAAADTAQTSTPPFISPVTHIDAATGVAVMFYRDTETGETESQYPSKAALSAYAATDAPAAGAVAATAAGATAVAPTSAAAAAKVE